jgi:two-component system sensor histidine kinase CssS
MEGKFRSINFKIWRIMTITILMFFGIVIIINITVIKNIKDEFIFKQLEETSQSIGIHHKNLPPRNIHTNILIEGPGVANFEIIKNKDTFDIIVDPFTRDFYRDKKNGEKTFNKIVNNIIKSKNKIVKGSLIDGNMITFYYIKWDDTSENATVFLNSLPKQSYIETELIFMICFLLIISFFISRIVAKKISKPIQELELFAKEIAKRNWKSEVPIADHDEIGLLAEALEKMRNSLKMYEERDRQFLQSTSHDLKTPVMIIKGYAQSMIDGITINSEHSGAEVIKTEAERLERKITQLLKLNTLSHSLEHSESREYIRIDRILKNLTSKFKVIKPELEWIVDLKEIEILGDSEALLIAFENIIENQIRFAENSISIIMNDHPKAEILISNDGPHFDVKNPDILFETYTKDKSGKFGLGLSIVKQIIKSHNGSIEAYNIEKGVEFKINLL